MVSEYGAVGSSVDCAQSWLRKIEPPEVGSEKTGEKELDVPVVVQA